MTILPFDIAGPLPTGITVLEASAGTGKTYTIAALAARYVAEEGIPLEQLLLVTFTRMATGELRERVRERFVSLEHALSGGDGDELSRLLAAGDVELRRSRLASALADFDAATIVTTHGFCQEVLAGLGIAGDMERDPTLVEDIRDLVDEVVDDLYVRRFHNRETPPFSRDEAARIARIAIENPATPLAPPGDHERRRDAPPARAGGACRARRAQAADGDHDLRRPADPAPRRPDRRRRRRRGRAAAGALPRRARRRVPGHRSGAVGDRPPRVRRRHARADRRSEAGHLRVPRRRRLRLPGSGADRRHAADARGQLAQRPGPDRRLRRDVRRHPARARGDRLPARARA